MTASRAERRRAGFERTCIAVATRLPWRLKEIVAPTFVGFAAINGCTFVLDLILVVLVHGLLGWTLWVAVGLAYAVALACSFVLNRALNFRTHRPVGPQLGIWLVVVVVNYGGIVIGVTTGLAALGLAYPLARLSAGGLEAVFMYSSMRWLVFRDRPLLSR